MKIDKSTAGLVLAALVVLVAGALGVYALTPIPERPVLLHSLSSPAGQFVSLGLIAAGAWVSAYKARATHAETAAQTPMLEQIQHQTNGNLDKRLAATKDATVKEILEALNARGVIAGETVPTDTGEAPQLANGSFYDPGLPTGQG